jgi:hypothetical protein
MSPSMPSGGWLEADDWWLVCDLCRERDLALISDAAMERLLFDGRPLIHPLRFEGMADRTVVVGSLSKEHRMDWLAGRVGVRPSDDPRGCRRGAHLQHDDADRDRGRRRPPCFAAIRDMCRSAWMNFSDGVTASSRGCLVAVHPSGRWLVAAPRRRRSRLYT